MIEASRCVLGTMAVRLDRPAKEIRHADTVEGRWLEAGAPRLFGVL